MLLLTLEEKHVRVVKLGLEFFLTSFSFSFLFFYFYFLNLGLGFSVTLCHISHIAVTSHVVAKEEHRRFWKDDVI